MGRDRRSKSASKLPPVAMLVLAVAPRALAEDQREEPGVVRYAVRYRAPDGCPTQEDFLRRVETRSARAERAGAEGAEVMLDVTLERESEHVTGLLRVTLRDGGTSERRVGDESCDTAASSLAVMSALMLDSHLRTPDDRPVETSAPPAAPPATAPGTRAQAVTPPRREAPPSRRGSRPRVRVHASWEHAVAPSVPVGALAGAELAWPRDGVVSPAVSAAAVVTFGQREVTQAGAASFRLLALRLAGCPVAFALPFDASLRPCVEADAGALTGKAGASVLNRATRTMPWLALGLSARAELPLAGGLSLEAGGGGRALARHDRFFFRPGVPVHDVPPWSASASLGLSYGF